MHNGLSTEVDRLLTKVQATTPQEGGVLGASYMDGKPRVETSDGQKWLASSFLLALLSQSANQVNILESLETTMELLKDCGKAEVATRK